MIISRNIFCAVLALLVIGGWLQIGTPPIPTDDKLTLKMSHILFNWHSREITVWGVNPKNADEKMFRGNSTPHFLKTLGYGFRAYVKNLPAWLTLSSSLWGGKQPQIIIREEIVDEFKTPELYTVYDDNLKKYLANADRLEKEFSTPFVFFLVPTKVYGNQIPVLAKDILLEHRKAFHIGRNGVPEVPGTNQKRIEDKIASSGHSVISLLEEYKDLHTRYPGLPLYSIADSHWSRRLIYLVGSSMMKQVIQQKSIPTACYEEAPISQAIMSETEPYWGDLFNYLQLESWVPLASRLKSLDIPDFSKEPVQPKDPRCPDILYAGTSYGAVYGGNGDIAQSMGRHYRGVVKNESIPAKGPFGFVEPLKKVSIKKGSILIWEFPFRGFKDAGVFLSIP